MASQLEVRVAELDANLHERHRFTASPEDSSLSAFAFAASSGDALGVVFGTQLGAVPPHDFRFLDVGQPDARP